MGGVIVIGLLILLVCHAGSKVITLEATIKESNGSANLPPDTSIAATGAKPTPSPATALGSPTAASAEVVKLDTNSTWALPLPAFYTVGLEQAGLQGVPLPMVPNSQFNGYNAVPARTKQLLTGAPPRRTGNVPPPAPPPSPSGPVSSGDVQYKL